MLWKYISQNCKAILPGNIVWIIVIYYFCKIKCDGKHNLPFIDPHSDNSMCFSHKESLCRILSQKKDSW